MNKRTLRMLLVVALVGGLAACDEESSILDPGTDPQAVELDLQVDEDLVELIELDGKEYLFYKSRPIDVALIRGTSVDVEGNLTMEEEVFYRSPGFLQIEALGQGEGHPGLQRLQDYVAV